MKMVYLPLESLFEDDVEYTGKELVLLANLKRSGLPVLEGIVVFPPPITAHQYSKYLETTDKNSLEQRLEVWRKEFFQTPIPAELKEWAKSNKIKSQQLWLNLLEKWFNQLKKQLMLNEFSRIEQLKLWALPVFLASRVPELEVEAWYDPHLDKIDISVLYGKWNDKENEPISHLVNQARKILILPYKYHLVYLAKKGWLIKHLSEIPVVVREKIAPEEFEIPLIHQPQLPVNSQTIKYQLPPALKVIVDLEGSMVIDHHAGGVLVEFQSYQDQSFLTEALIEAAKVLKSGHLFFRFSTPKRQFGTAHGLSELLHNDTLLNNQLNFLAKIKAEHHLRPYLLLPQSRGVHEVEKIKQRLKEVDPKFLIWLEMGIPNNFLQIDKYLGLNLDGIVINLNDLAGWLGGYDPQHPENVIFALYTQQLEFFLTPYLTFLKKNHFPILVKGSMSLDPKMIEFLIKMGVGGIISSVYLSNYLSEQVRAIEKKVIKKKIANISNPS